MAVQVYLWDQRGGSAPRVKLGKGDKHSVNSLQLSDDSHLLLTSTAAGDVSDSKPCAALYRGGFVSCKPACALPISILMLMHLQLCTLCLV